MWIIVLYYLSNGFNESRTRPHLSLVAQRMAKRLMSAIVVERFVYLYNSLTDKWKHYVVARHERMLAKYEKLKNNLLLTKAWNTSCRPYRYSRTGWLARDRRSSWPRIRLRRSPPRVTPRRSRPTCRSGLKPKQSSGKQVEIPQEFRRTLRASYNHRRKTFLLSRPWCSAAISNCTAWTIPRSSSATTDARWTDSILCSSCRPRSPSSLRPTL